MPLREVERRFAELGEEAKAGGPVARVFCYGLPRPSTPYERRARTQLARVALAWAAAAGRGPLPAAPPLLLADPLTEPPRPLRWRRDGDRAFTLWSVGSDRVDDEAARAAEPDGAEKDLALRVKLP